MAIIEQLPYYICILSAILQVRKCGGRGYKTCLNCTCSEIVAMELVEGQHRKYCDRMKTYTGINRIWIVHNFNDIHEYIQDINTKKGAKNMSTFDFSSLHTNIEHDELKVVMEYAITKAFIGSRMEKMSIYSTSARWTNNLRSGTTSIDDKHC